MKINKGDLLTRECIIHLGHKFIQHKVNLVKYLSSPSICNYTVSQGSLLYGIPKLVPIFHFIIASASQRSRIHTGKVMVGVEGGNSKDRIESFTSLLKRDSTET